MPHPESTMLIAGQLFSQSLRSGQMDVLGWLADHKRNIIRKINSITDLDQMTDQVVQNLVADSLVRPLALHEPPTKQVRSEEFRAEELPHELHFLSAPLPGSRFHKNVWRISIRFTGNPELLHLAP